MLLLVPGDWLSLTDLSAFCSKQGGKDEFCRFGDGRRKGKDLL